MIYLAGMAGVLLACWWLLQLYGLRLLFRRSRVFRAGKSDTSLAVEDVYFTAADGTELHGWWFPHTDAKGVIVVCHGNAGNISDRLWIAEDLQDLPVHIFLFDYRGYGLSKGVPSETGVGLDVIAACETASKKMNAGEENPPVFLYGRSLGGAVALQGAASFPVRGVILENTFLSILDVGRRFYPWLLPRFTCRHPFRSDVRIAGIEAPILMAHAVQDETIPFDMGEALYKLAPIPEGFYRLKGGHGDSGWQSSPEYAEAFRSFILSRI